MHFNFFKSPTSLYTLFSGFTKEAVGTEELATDGWGWRADRKEGCWRRGAAMAGGSRRYGRESSRGGWQRSKRWKRGGWPESLEGKEGMLAGKRKRNRREGEAEERKGWEKAATASQQGWRLQPPKSED